MTLTPSPTAHYVNVVDPVNAGFAELRAQLRRKDLRVFCLLDFETILSFMLDKPITEYEAYKKMREHIHLDEYDPYKVLDYNTFRWVMSQYEEIMREAKLIGISWKKRTVNQGHMVNYFSEEDDDEV